MIEVFSLYVAFFNSPCVFLLEMMCATNINSAK